MALDVASGILRVFCLTELCYGPQPKSPHLEKGWLSSRQLYMVYKGLSLRHGL